MTVSNVQIIPAILANSEDQFQADITKISNVDALNGGWVHIDFADNKFVQNQTINPEIIKKFPLNFRKEAHLMVENPRDWIDSLIAAGFERVIIHVEATDINQAVDYARGLNLEVGLAIKNETNASNLQDFIDRINTVLIMSIIPGFQGQQFIPNSLKKIQEINKFAWPVRLGVDGAVNNQNIRKIINAGADFVIVGSYLLKGDINENLEMLWESL